MKRLTIVADIILMLGLIFCSALPAAKPVQSEPQSAAAMSGWPAVAHPIPHHEPGQPARSGSATYQVLQTNAQGETQTVELTGLDALLADGTLSDPLGANYRLVNLDNIMFGQYNISAAGNDYETRTFPYVAQQELNPITDTSYGNFRFTTIAAGDLNGDLVDEQIVAWADPADNKIYMNIGDLPNYLGKLISAPGVVALADGSLDVFARGYDQALWALHYDGVNWGTWNNTPGGELLSAPAVASRANGEMDVFAINLDNQLCYTHWNGANWSEWELVPEDPDNPIFPEISASIPVQYVPSPAVVASGDSGLDVFRIAADHTLYWRSLSDGGATWAAWVSLGGMLASAPAAVSLGNGRMQVYALGPDGALWYRTYNNNWGAWMRLETPDGVAGNAAPVLTSPATGQVVVRLAGTENRIWKNQFNGSTWSGWSSSAVVGQLGPGIGAAVGPSGTYLFAQMDDSSLQYCLNGASWASLAGPVTSQTSGIGAITKTLPADPTVLRNTIFDITTGYFTGDGRQQIVLAYVGADDKLRLEIYDIHDGFQLKKIAELATPFAGGSPAVAAGDVDGDGVDEIGLVDAKNSLNYNLTVFQLNSAVLNQIDQKTDAFLWGNYYTSAGTLRIAAGDVVPDPDPKNPTDPKKPNDEFVVLSDWWYTGYRYGAQLRVYDYNADGWPWDNHGAGVIQAGSAGSTYIGHGLDVAVGNVDGIGNDEIIFTWPYFFNSNQWADLVRRLQVFDCSKDDKGIFSFVDKNKDNPITVPDYTNSSFLDRLAVGDVNEDLKDDIVMARASYDGTSFHVALDVYDYDDDGNPVFINHTVVIKGPVVTPRALGLALGDFTGDSIRVGPPTYRTQRGKITPLVILNMPPVHRDIIDGVGEIVIDNGATATYTNDTTTTIQRSSESKRDWSLSTGVEESNGAAGFTVKTSLDNTYGENFSASTKAIVTNTHNDSTTAEKYDQLIYNATDYGIWEYPVYGVQASDSNQPTTIAVVWPLVTMTTQPTTAQGDGGCDVNFYAPSHQTYNVWSYDAIDAPIFADFQPDGLIEGVQSSGGTKSIVGWTSTSTQEISKGFTDQISAGLSFSYENKLDIPLIGSAWDFSFRASTKSTFNIGQTSTLTNTFTQGTSVTLDFPASPDKSAYNILSILYWAKAGYLVMDYQTHPLANGSWLLYNKPDPAFILPWYGFPDPVTGVFPLPPSLDAPPCGLDQQLFTHDITISPAFAENGDQVTLNATVHNFSDVLPPAGVANVLVQFYLGAPASSNQIGSCTVTRASLNRASGPATCSTTWTVTGASGEEKIYAVIDPNNAFPEMHEAGSKINNNTGYGILNVAGANYFDPGLSQQQAFQNILYQEAPGTLNSLHDVSASGLGYGLYLPTTNGEESTRYELMPTTIHGVSSVGTPIQVLAFLGGQKDPQENYTFGIDPKNVIPVGLMAEYRDSDLPPGTNEANLKLYRLDGTNWVDATCPGYAITRFPQDNRLVVPICQTGTFVLSDSQPLPQGKFYFPVIKK